MDIRSERPADANIIAAVTTAAFIDIEHGGGNEAKIVDALRKSGALTISLVAVIGDEIVGHVAFSPVRINGEPSSYYGLGPVSVRPDRQRAGIGSALVRCGLKELRAMRAAGCVVLGDPAYYRRFDFESDTALRFGSAPPEYFQRVVFEGGTPVGEVTYHPGFDVT